MKTSTSIQNPPGARASGSRGSLTSPPMNHDSSLASAGRGHNRTSRWRRRANVSAIAIVAWGCCGLLTQAASVFEPVRTFTVPGDWESVAVSRGGKQVLGAFQGGPVTLWDVQTGDVLRTFEGGTAPVAFSPDERWVFTGSSNHVARLWDTQSANLVRALEGHTNALTGVVFSSDGQRLLTGSLDGTARLWDTQTGQAIYTLAHTNSVVSVAFSPDGRQVLTGEEEGPPRLWAADTGQLERVVEGLMGPVAFGHGGGVIGLKDLDWLLVSPGGRLAVDYIFCGPGSVMVTARLVEAETGRLLRAGLLGDGNNWPWRSAWVRRIAFSPDCRHMLIAPDLWDIGYLVDWLAEGRLNQPDVATRPLGTFRTAPLGTIRVTAILHPNQRHVLANGTNSVSLWDIRSGELVRSFQGRALALSADGAQVLTGGPDQIARLWETETGELVRTFSGHAGEVISVAFSPSRENVLTGSTDGTARLWNASTGQLRYTFKHTAGDQAATPSPAFSRDGRRVFTGGVWDGHTGEPLRTWDAVTGALLHTYPDGSAFFTADLEHVLIAADDWRTLSVHETSTGQPVNTGHAEPGWRFTVRPHDLAQFANGDIESNRRVWEECLGGARFGLAYFDDQSPNGKWVLSHGADGAEMSDAQWGIRLRTFALDQTDWWIGHFSPDGQFVLTIYGDGLGQVWDLRDRLAGIRTSQVGGKLELRWELGILQSAESANGPWQDVTNAVSPFQVDLAAGARFYRVKVEE
jgi:WD40 repeat protein